MYCSDPAEREMRLMLRLMACIVWLFGFVTFVILGRMTVEAWKVVAREQSVTVQLQVMPKSSPVISAPKATETAHAPL